MATPINTPLTGDIWHLSIDDLLSTPMSAKLRLGGPGPFVINLSASTAPISQPPKALAACPNAHVYQIQRIEDHRMRFRLRLGPFASEDAAEAVLDKVRDLYPSALTATVDADDARAIEVMQAKLAALRKPEKPGAAVPPQAALVTPPPPPALAPVLSDRVVPARTPAASAGPVPIPTLTQASATPRAIAAASIPTLMPAPVPARAPSTAPLAPATGVVTAVAAMPAAHQVATPPRVVAPPRAAAPPRVTAPPVAALRAVVQPVTAPAPASSAPPTAPVGPVMRVMPAATEVPAARSIAAAPENAAAHTASAPPAPLEFAPRWVEQLSSPLPSLESTQTLRPITPLELESEAAPHWFAIQLSIAEQAFDPDALPNLDIFSEYRLYSVAGLEEGRLMHALRLGFFGDAVAAGAVSSYLAAFYENPTVKRVSAAERERFAEQRLEARKDIGATGRHAVIEITSERVVRENRGAFLSVLPCIINQSQGQGASARKR